MQRDTCKDQKEASRSQKRQTDSPRDSSEGMGACRHLHCRTSDFQNHEINNLCCFKPLSLLLLITATIGNSYRHTGANLFIEKKKVSVSLVLNSKRKHYTQKLYNRIRIPTAILKTKFCKGSLHMAFLFINFNIFTLLFLTIAFQEKKHSKKSEGFGSQENFWQRIVNIPNLKKNQNEQTNKNPTQ